MPKRNKHGRPKDVNQLAHHLVSESTDSPDEHRGLTFTAAQISVYMAAIGRKGGKVGGKRRLETMTPKQRKEVARNAAKKRWEGTGHTRN